MWQNRAGQGIPLYLFVSATSQLLTPDLYNRASVFMKLFSMGSLSCVAKARGPEVGAGKNVAN